MGAKAVLVKILLFGKNGQVGQALQKTLAPLGELNSYGRQEADFEKPEEIRALIRKHTPDIIVNAVAYTAVDKAEDEFDKAKTINADTVSLLAQECARLDSWPIHYSTDYVFDGKKTGSYQETDTPHPLNNYGQTKLLGERAIQESGCRHLIFRTSWVYSTTGKNFIKTVLRLANERNELKMVADQVGAPSSAEFIAETTALAIKKIPDRIPKGIYHLTPRGKTSWWGLAKYIVTLAQEHGASLNVSPKNILPVDSKFFPLPAKRPKNSLLDSTKLSKVLQIPFPMWQHHAYMAIMELIKRQKAS